MSCWVCSKLEKLDYLLEYLQNVRLRIHIMVYATATTDSNNNDNNNSNNTEILVHFLIVFCMQHYRHSTPCFKS